MTTPITADPAVTPGNWATLGQLKLRTHRLPGVVIPHTGHAGSSEGAVMITANDLELRAGARILLEPMTLRVQNGDRIGLVGRNGAGKTTSMRVLAGEGLPHAGAIDRRGPVGYLPQDPRTGDLEVTARDRVLSARGLDTLVRDIAKIQVRLAETPHDDNLVRKYGNLEDRFTALGGYAAESEAA